VGNYLLLLLVLYMVGTSKIDHRQREAKECKVKKDVFIFDPITHLI
jgi:hypothetical protein